MSQQNILLPFPPWRGVGGEASCGVVVVWKRPFVVLFLRIPLCRVQSPLVQQHHIFLGDVSRFNGFLHYVFVIGKRYQLHICCFKRLFGNGEPVGVGCNHAHHFATSLSDSLDSLQATATCGDEVFDNHNLLTRFQIAFDQVFQSVIFGFAPYIHKRQLQGISYQRALSDCSRGNTCHSVGLREMFEHGMR